MAAVREGNLEEEQTGEYFSSGFMAINFCRFESLIALNYFLTIHQEGLGAVQLLRNALQVEGVEFAKRYYVLHGGEGLSQVDVS